MPINDRGKAELSQLWMLRGTIQYARVAGGHSRRPVQRTGYTDSSRR